MYGPPFLRSLTFLCSYLFCLHDLSITQTRQHTRIRYTYLSTSINISLQVLLRSLPSAQAITLSIEIQNLRHWQNQSLHSLVPSAGWSPGPLQLLGCTFVARCSKFKSARLWAGPQRRPPTLPPFLSQCRSGCPKTLVPRWRSAGP